MNAARGEAPVVHLATLSGWCRLERRGDEWVVASRALGFWSMTQVVVDPEAPETVYVASERSGLFVSWDGGASWERPQPNVPHLSLFALLALPGALLAGTVPAALYRREPDGSWTELEDVRRGGSGGSFPPNPDLGTRTRYLAADPADPARLYAGIEVGGLLLSDDGGATWAPSNDGLTDADVHQVLPCARSPELVVAACGEGVFRSRDRAAHWEEVTPAGPRTYGMAVAEADDGSVYLGMTLGRPNTWVRPGKAEGAIFRSRDGARWEPVVEGLSGGVMDLCAAPDGSGVLAATSDGSLLAVEGAGCRTLASGLPCITSVAVGAA